MQPDGGLPRLLRLLDDGNHFFQGHFCAVMNLAAFLAVFQQRRIHQRTGVDHHIRLLEQPLPPNRYQIHGAASRAYKMHHDAPSLHFSSSSRAFSLMPRMPYSLE